MFTSDSSVTSFANVEQVSVNAIQSWGHAQCLYRTKLASVVELYKHPNHITYIFSIGQLHDIYVRGMAVKAQAIFTIETS